MDIKDLHTPPKGKKRSRHGVTPVAWLVMGEVVLVGGALFLVSVVGWLARMLFGGGH